ncbi:hypothetical protein ACI3LY_004420 [Candidozyma auris]|uniref:Uncharacterized protein n=2 Tax=Candidozyma auris TaxID=498019 RepID=A0A2H0ZDS8_CANAR|nr:hypothetical_protein [[Candida] auris]KNE01519.2 hypothetical protein QG37_01345 [[Candida] auris]PIS48463.1 hypothetical protein B9J08_005156 [[Candida] auris]QEO23056.1 hypothetical_protein [[Candida] auris]QWW24762.1 hypothetical protein CA7LBN_003619 [[Candida] auris]GBL49103.1 hypothetical protein CAJCM15448_13770 [[Candida] auris]
MESSTPTRAERVKALLSEHVKEHVALSNPVQEAYEKKLSKDIDRTSNFLKQAEHALEKLNSEDTAEHDSWTDETRRKANSLALFEMYKKLPYTVMKNDSLGTATAAHLTGEAVVQQEEATKSLKSKSDALKQELDFLKTTLADYKTMSALLEKRIASHPRRVEVMEQKLHNAQHVDDELLEKTEQVKEATRRIKSVEEKLQQHMVRVITKLHAMLDWENTGMVDEETFKRKIKQSIQLIQQLVHKLVSDTEGWVSVTPGSSEEQLVQLMHRNNIIEIRNTGDFAIRLRSYGSEF